MIMLGNLIMVQSAIFYHIITEFECSICFLIIQFDLSNGESELKQVSQLELH